MRMTAIALRRSINWVFADVATRSPAWDAGLFAVNARARHWVKFYGLAPSLARLPAAVANSSRNGW
jgi:superfamily I DNA and RNA helicase